MRSRTFLPALLAGLLLAGCAQSPIEEASTADAAAARAPEMDWSPGTWWAYHAVVQGVPIDVTLVVSEATPTGYVLGTNLTNGFFGLPWTGNVTADRNPVLSDEVWPLFAPPLEDGKSWTYQMRGYDATAVARAARIEGPDATRDGFVLEATSWGRTFARYEYAPTLGWFRSLALLEPTNGEILLEATLVAYGDHYLDDYYVERALRKIEIGYPALPGSVELRVPAGAIEVHATLAATSTAGAFQARLLSGAGQTLAEVSSLGRGTDTDRAATRSAADLHWTIEHAGAGVGRVTLEITGVFPAQSTRPDRPQDGHAISTESPLRV